MPTIRNPNFTLNLNSNLRATQAQINESLAETAMILGRGFTQAISSPTWDWINPPSPRDIVDTGRLRASQRIDQSTSGVVTFFWDVDYAAPVHEGAILKNGTMVPARPWTTKALGEIDVPNVYATILRRKLGL